MPYDYSSMHLSAVLLILSLVLINESNSLSIKLTMDTTSADTTISTYNTNVGVCSCDTHPLSCDIFCCCDPTCSTVILLSYPPQTQTSTWTTNTQCLNTATSIQRSCNQLSTGGFFSFQDLACVYYSNRGNISYFYSYPDSGSLNYPTANKFVAVKGKATSIGAVATTAGTEQYSGERLGLKGSNGTTINYVQVWAPVAGGKCDVGFVNISQSQTYSCSYALTPTTCLTNTALFSSTTYLCQTGNCSTTTPLPTLLPSSTDNTTCFNLITQQSISLTLSSSGSSYTIDSLTITLTQSNISILSNPSYQIKTTVMVTKTATAVGYSGNPGYVVGKSVKMVSSGGVYRLYSLEDASGNCVTTSAAASASTAVDLLFGQNAVYSCVSSNPCDSSLYIDQIAKQTTLNINKWAKGSTDTVQLTGTSATLNTCSQQSVVIDVLYTNAGWVADMQNYILGAKLSTQASTQASWNRKYLKINWIYVDPSTISTPPTNYFYSYFSYLWKPLRDYFGVY